MDPNKTLADLLIVAARVHHATNSLPDPIAIRALAHDAEILAKGVIDLNQWVTRGGALPKKWAR